MGFGADCSGVMDVGPCLAAGLRRVLAEDTRGREAETRVVIVYESMYGNTHVVANCVAEALRHQACDVTVVPVGKATKELLGHCDLLVVGAPTPVHGLPWPRRANRQRERPTSLAVG